MRRDWFEVLVCVVSVCKKMVVEWMLLSWLWYMVFGLTGFGFDGKGGLRIWRYGKLWSGLFEVEWWFKTYSLKVQLMKGFCESS